MLLPQEWKLKKGTRDQHVAALSSQDKLSTARIAIFVNRERASIFRAWALSAHERFHANALIFCLDIEFCFHATQLSQSRFIFKLVFDFRLQWWLNRVCVRASARVQCHKKRNVEATFIICTMHWLQLQLPNVKSLFQC